MAPSSHVTRQRTPSADNSPRSAGCPLSRRPKSWRPLREPCSTLPLRASDYDIRMPMSASAFYDWPSFDLAATRPSPSIPTYDRFPAFTEISPIEVALIVADALDRCGLPYVVDGSVASAFSPTRTLYAICLTGGLQRKTTRPHLQRRTSTTATPPGTPSGTTRNSRPCRVTVRPAMMPAADPNTASLNQWRFAGSREIATQDETSTRARLLSIPGDVRERWHQPGASPPSVLRPDL